MFKSCGLAGQWIDACNGHSFSDRNFTQGLKIEVLCLCVLHFGAFKIGISPMAFTCGLALFNAYDDIIAKRYMVPWHYVRLGVKPSRHKWHASRPSWVGLRTERERERERSVNLLMSIINGQIKGIVAIIVSFCYVCFIFKKKLQHFHMAFPGSNVERSNLCEGGKKRERERKGKRH